MTSGLDADEKRSGLDAKQAGTPLPPFCVSAHSRRLREFILWLRRPMFLAEKAAETGGSKAEKRPPPVADDSWARLRIQGFGKIAMGRGSMRDVTLTVK
jgi:hypothetical protein